MVGLAKVLPRPRLSAREGWPIERIGMLPPRLVLPLEHQDAWRPRNQDRV